MNNWQRWLQAPQTTFFRRALFQVHLWAGIGLGLYVLVISLSGTALLLKSPFYTWFEPKKIDPPAGVEPMSDDEQRVRMEEIYKGYSLGFTMFSTEPDRGTYIVLQKDGEYIPHYFNQYTGEDMGSARPWPIRSVEWLANVHAELMLGRQVGRKINGVGGALFVLMSITGLIIWWRGRARWYEGLMIRRKSSYSFLWQLHTFIGFWALLLMLAWGISGFQLGFPQEMNIVINWFDFDLNDGKRPDSWLRFFRSVHFARLGDQNVFARWGWIIASVLPAVMFVSGFILWWRRVVRRWMRSWTR